VGEKKTDGGKKSLFEKSKSRDLCTGTRTVGEPNARPLSKTKWEARSETGAPSPS